MSESKEQKQKKSDRRAGRAFVIILVVGFSLFIYVLYSLDLDTQEAIVRNTEQVQQLFGGEYSLRKLQSDEVESERWEGDGKFFMVMGDFSASGGTETKREMVLSWQLYNEKYTHSRVPYGKVYVKIDDSVEDPYLIFEIDEKQITSEEEDYKWYKANELLGTDLIPAITVICREDHWEKRVEESF